MKRFRFRLQSLLVVRDAAEKRAREGFLSAQRSRVELSAGLAEARSASESACAESLNARRDRLGAVECVRLHETAVRAQNAVVVAEEAEARARAEEDSARAAWIEARRQVKLLERLREKARIDHFRECGRIEQEMLDELAVLRSAAGRAAS